MMARMGWGMEDPAAAARERLGRRVDETWAESPRRARSRDGLLVVLFIVLAAGAIWWTVGRADDAAADDPATRVARGEVTGLAGDSLARPVNLAPMLAAMAATAAPEDRLVALRIAPGEVQATVVTPGGDEYFLTGDLDGDVGRREFAQTNRTSTTTFGRVDPADVKRAVTTVVRMSGLPATALDYLVLNWPEHLGQTIFVRFAADRAADRDWVGTGDGSTMRRVNAPASSSSTTTRTTVTVRGSGAQGERARRIAECVASAGGDATRIMECVR